MKNSMPWLSVFFIWADLFSFWTQAGLKAELAMSRQKSRVHSRIVKTTRTLGVRRIKVEDISGLKHHSCLLTAAGMCGREWAQGWPVKLSCVGGGERNLVKTRNKTAETRGPGRLAAWPAWPGLVKCVSSGWWLGTWGWPLVPAYYSKVGQQPWQVRPAHNAGLSWETNVRGLDRGSHPCHNMQPHYIHFLIDNLSLCHMHFQLHYRDRELLGPV